MPSRTNRNIIRKSMIEKSRAPRTRDYTRFVGELKDRIVAARVTAARAVNAGLILLYWDIGRAIVEKQELHGWGDSVVEKLSKDLRRAFPDMKGFSPDNLWRMRQIHLEYSSTAFLEQLVPELRRQHGEFLEQVVPEMTRTRKSIPAQPEQIVMALATMVPWGHHVELMKKTAEPAAKIYYLAAAARYGWSRNVLLNQIKAGAHERARRERKSINFAKALPGHLAEQADEAMKSSYNLEFLGIRRAMKERKLEQRLIDSLRDFILELGYGFCFVGQQCRITLGRKEYFIDLLFYHRFLKALVAVELKAGDFEPEYAGKMDFYLNVLNERERAPGDNPSIGIILCGGKDSLEVEFALKSKTNPIGVADYQLRAKLPREMKGKLPTALQLKQAVRGLLPGG